MDRAGLLERDVVHRVVDDVLADALEPTAGQMHDRAQPLEPARHLGPQPLERVAVDLERQVGE